MRGTIGEKKRMTTVQKADAYVAKLMAHRRGERVMGDSETDSDDSSEAETDDDVPYKDPRLIKHEAMVAAFEAYKRKRLPAETARREARMAAFEAMDLDEAKGALDALQKRAMDFVEAQRWEEALFEMNEAEACVRAVRGRGVDPVAKSASPPSYVPGEDSFPRSGGRS